jgi:hypothetical protein
MATRFGASASLPWYRPTGNESGLAGIPGDAPFKISLDRAMDMVADNCAMAFCTLRS